MARHHTATHDVYTHRALLEVMELVCVCCDAKYNCVDHHSSYSTSTGRCRRFTVNMAPPCDCPSHLPPPSAPAERAVLDGRQKALKLTTNALYGFTGAQASPLQSVALADSCLALGAAACRGAIATLTEAVEAGKLGPAGKGAKVWVGWGGIQWGVCIRHGVCRELGGQAA